MKYIQVRAEKGLGCEEVINITSPSHKHFYAEAGVFHRQGDYLTGS